MNAENAGRWDQPSAEPLDLSERKLIVRSLHRPETLPLSGKHRSICGPQPPPVGGGGIEEASGEWVHWRAMADAVLDAQAAERSRIATEVHDDTVQVMTATLVLLDRVAQMVEHHADMELNILLAEACSVVSDAVERARRLHLRTVADCAS